MHFGHTYNNYGPLDYLDVGYKSNGLQIGKGRATIVGSGPLASAPAASANNGLYWYDNVTSTLWVSVDGTWGFTDYPDLESMITLINDNGSILIDDTFVVLVEN